MRDLLFLQQAYESAQKRCLGSTKNFCHILGEGTPRAQGYGEEIKGL